MSNQYYLYQLLFLRPRSGDRLRFDFVSFAFRSGRRHCLDVEDARAGGCGGDGGCGETSRRGCGAGDNSEHEDKGQKQTKQKES